jgi:hypothetical protein
MPENVSEQLWLPPSKEVDQAEEALPEETQEETQEEAEVEADHLAKDQ